LIQRYRNQYGGRSRGTARYGADVRLPGMKYAVIARPPVTGGKVASFDGAAAMKVSGVEKVMEVKGQIDETQLNGARVTAIGG
jgi:CO/xanthine dehydrogenase Mo-binding subunit